MIVQNVSIKKYQNLVFFLFFMICFIFFMFLNYHLCPLTQYPYFVRSMTPSFTRIESRMIIMYFNPDLVGDLVLSIKIKHSIRLTWTCDKIIDNSKILSCVCVYIYINWNNFPTMWPKKNHLFSWTNTGISTCPWIFFHWYWTSGQALMSSPVYYQEELVTKKN